MSKNDAEKRFTWSDEDVEFDPVPEKPVEWPAANNIQPPKTQVKIDGKDWTKK